MQKKTGLLSQGMTQEPGEFPNSVLDGITWVNTISRVLSSQSKSSGYQRAFSISVQPLSGGAA
jgi:hypothetical protein